MVELMKPRALNHVVAHLPGVHEALHGKAEETKVRAELNLEAVRATTTHTKIAKERAHETRIGMGKAEGEYRNIDFEVYMEGEDPMALEFGHAPSGAFDPEKYGHVTKAPHGRYILSSAAGYEGLNLTPAPSGRVRGKR